MIVPLPPKDRALLSRRGKRSKDKGKDWERTIAALVAGFIGLPVDDVYNARSGRKECDIRLSSEARRRFPFYLECKNEKGARVPAWIRQMEGDLSAARKAGEAFRLGMVVFKQHGDRTPYALVRFDQLLELVIGKRYSRGEDRGLVGHQQAGEVGSGHGTGGTRRRPLHGAHTVQVVVGGTDRPGVPVLSPTSRRHPPGLQRGVRVPQVLVRS